MNAAVFLDRDNTIIHNDGDLGDPAQVKLIQGAASAIASLRGLGYKIVVVTNQGGVARGKFTESDVEAVHQRINELLLAMTGTCIDRFYYCPYHPEGIIERYRREHSWRKPQAGMLLQAAKDLDVDLMQSWMVGDQMRDIEAGYAAGVRTVLLRPDAEELTPLRLEEIFTKQTEIIYKRTGELGPYFTSRNLIEAVRIVAQQRRPETPEEFRAKERLKKLEPPKPTPDPRSAEPPGPPASSATPAPVAPAAPPIHVSTTTRAAQLAAQASPAPLPPRPVAAPAPEPTPVPPPRPVAVEAPPAPAPAKRVPPPPPFPEKLPEKLPEKSAASQTGNPPQTGESLEKLHDIATSLKLMLQEIRNQRSVSDSFSFPMMFAMILQTIAVTCLALAVLLGWNNLDLFMRWTACAIFIQLCVITSLLYKR